MRFDFCGIWQRIDFNKLHVLEHKESLSVSHMEKNV